MTNANNNFNDKQMQAQKQMRIAVEAGDTNQDNIYNLKPNGDVIRITTHDRGTYKEIISYYRNGYAHRDNGPAVITKHAEIYCQDGQRHRLDGPAVVCRSGCLQWWVRGEHLTEEEFNAKYS